MTEWHFGKQLERVEKWDGNYRYPGSALKKRDIDAKAIARQPLIKKRPVNIIRNVSLPKDLAMKVAKGLKGIGAATTFLGVVEVGSKTYSGNITLEHGLTTLAITGVSLATGGLGGIAIAVVYAIYEDDIWNDYDKENASNFIGEK